MKTLLKLTIILLPLISFSQISIGIGMGKSKAEGTIYMNDGKQIKGVISFPEYSDKTIKHEKVKYESTQIDSIVFSKCTFIYTKGKEYNERKEEFVYFKKEGWMCKILKGKVSLFLYGQKYGFKEDKMFVNTGEVRYFGFRKGEDVPSLIGIDTQGFQGGFNAYFRTLASRYFSDNKEIKGKIENKDYKVKEIETLVKDYNLK
jgi:hypothetical protein